MNPELIKIAIENKAILDAIKAQIETQEITTAIATNKPLKNGGIWQIAFVAGLVIAGYNIYTYYNNKKRLAN
jgi:hypothetical protein